MANPLHLSPLNQRRIESFCANRRGYWSLMIFAVLFVICLLADGLANDRPLIVKYDGNWYFPIVEDYPETTFGGDFDVATDFYDPYLRGKIQNNGFAVWPIIPFSYDTIDFNMREPLPAAPSSRHWLGTDDLGRDVLARLIYGFRISVLFGMALTLISSVIGIAAGAVQGYFGGWVDLTFQRVIEIWGGLPQLFILIILASLFAPGFWTLLFIMVLFNWMSLTGLVRAEFLRARNFEYVRAAKALGVGDFRIMTRHVLPNAMVATITFLPFVLNGSIVALTSLDFLGLGMPPGSPSLGELLSQGKNNLQAPWLGITAFFAIAIMLSLLIFIGEAVRDAFDPRKTF
ncbi:ABC transporter permease [Thalassospira sp. MCCC 1A01428]|jgi:microcin C transport system permease protein|uniref:ABC transporter permease n=1 Tax=unclassified Thalassospira TaxID=2648997 RepID=UPI000A1E0E26|nr:ABC transporter permease [Thalassospira sp. MCCC 1A01428]OSQ43880.1 ABC transporter permease [Thalassospira sp. MCCC 1A01428]